MLEVSGTTTPPVLQAENLCKCFGGVVAAKNVSLCICAHELVVISGPNGSGKTTVLNMLAGDLRPDSGRVSMQGRDVTHLGAAERCGLGIAKTFQIPRPFGRLTVLENALVAAEAGYRFGQGGKDQAKRAVRLVGLQEKTMWYANHLTWVEKRLLELARAIATTPTVMLIDEIIGGLHQDCVPQMISLLVRMRSKGLAIVVVEHRLHALAEVADRCMTMRNGILSE